MNHESQLREQLQRHTDDVLGGPDLVTSLRAGRSRRRVRTVAGIGGAGLATAAVLSLALVLPRAGGGTEAQPADGLPLPTLAPASLLPVDVPSTPTVPVDVPTVDVTVDPSDAPTVVDVPVESAPAPTGPAGTSKRGGEDFVPGTDRDETLAAIVADHLPGLPAPDDVYPSDVYTAGPLPDSAHARATDYQAIYTLGPGDTLTVFTGYAPVGEDVGERGVVREVSTSESGEFHTTSFAFANGFVVTALEVVTGGAEPTLAQAPLRGLVQDPSLRFEAPAGVPVRH